LCLSDVLQKGANPVPPPKGGRLGSLSMVLPTDKKSLPRDVNNQALIGDTRDDEN
jgi:hypothetical protein